MADHIPPGYTAVAPWVVTDDTGALLDFIAVAFRGEELSRVQVKDSSIGHAEIRVGDTVVLAFDRRPGWPTMPALLRVWVPDADAAMAAAVAAGARVITPSSDSAFGQRGGRVRDPFGNIWWVVSQVETLTEEEMWSRFARTEYADQMRIAQATLDAELSGSRASHAGLPVRPSPTTSRDPSLLPGEVRRRQEIVDRARWSAHRAGSATVTKSHRDQDAWARGHITLDELVALSQSTGAGAILADAGPATDRSAGAAAAQDLDLLAVVTASVTKAAVAAAATMTMQAAGRARAAHSAAAVRVAAATAETVRQAAHLVQLHVDDDADRVTSAAAAAASLVAMAVVPGTEVVQAERAAALAATIRAAAITKAEETALAAATVARAAATAAADAAATAADAAMALELQVADTAAAVQAVATATARRVALDTITAADLILASAR